MTDSPPGPSTPAASRADLFVQYLDYFRSTLATKVEAMPVQAQRSSRLASGWTPAELVKHLTFVELRWLEWGFDGRDVDQPWGDRQGDRWHVSDDESLDELLAALDEQGERSRAVIGVHDLAEVGKPSPRWDGAEPPTLERILFHLLQEYARHVGHLDIVAELAG
jgi:uncharacterized damage-inducible protein DinB